MNGILKKIITKIKPEILYQKHSYSECGEDLLLEALCHKYFKISKPSFIDVGGNHPFFFNNTYHFYKIGSRGINIEPNPILHSLLIKHRPLDINLNVGIDFIETEELRTLFIFEENPLLSTFDKNYLDFHLTHKMKYNSMQIKCISLKLLTEQFAGFEKPTILNIDVEGFEMNVLLSADWSVFQPKLICIENHKSIIDVADNKNSKIYKFLKNHNYELVAVNEVNDIYIQMNDL